MSDSKRLRVLKLLTQWYLQEITIANGYKHDLADVLRGRLAITDDQALPCISILENIEPDRDPRRAGANEELTGAKTNERWVLLVQGWVLEEFDFPCDAAYELMADVKKATAKLISMHLADTGTTIDMGGGDTPKAFHLGGLVNDIELEPGTVRPVEYPTEKAFFWMRVILKFTEVVSDPYRY